MGQIIITIGCLILCRRICGRANNLFQPVQRIVISESSSLVVGIYSSRYESRREVVFGRANEGRKWPITVGIGRGLDGGIGKFIRARVVNQRRINQRSVFRLPGLTYAATLVVLHVG